MTRSQVAVLMLAFLPVMMGKICSAQDGTDELKQRLIETSGAEYVQLRDRALELPEGGFRDLIEMLNGQGQYSTGRMVGIFLTARRDHPELAKEFDQRLHWTVENPYQSRPKSRARRLIYKTWLPEDTLDADSMGFEVCFKRTDLPDGVRRCFRIILNHPNSESIDVLLSFAYSSLDTLDVDALVGFTNVERGKLLNWLPGTFAQVTSGWLAEVADGLEQEQARLTPILVDLHVRFRRKAEHYESLSVPALQAFGGPEQLLALEQIIAFETLHFDAQGLRPWEAGTRLDRKYGDSVRHPMARKQGELARAQKAGDDALLVARLTNEVTELERQWSEYYENRQAQSVWDELMRARAALRSGVEEDSPKKVSGTFSRSTPAESLRRGAAFECDVLVPVRRDWFLRS